MYHELVRRPLRGGVLLVRGRERVLVRLVVRRHERHHARLQHHPGLRKARKGKRRASERTLASFSFFTAASTGGMPTLTSCFTATARCAWGAVLRAGCKAARCGTTYLGRRVLRLHREARQLRGRLWRASLAGVSSPSLSDTERSKERTIWSSPLRSL